MRPLVKGNNTFQNNNFLHIAGDLLQKKNC